jgi:Flp pilus assembly protein TadD
LPIFQLRLRIPLFAALALAACGGPVDGERMPVRSDAAPVLATLTAPTGSGTTELRSGNLAGARQAYELVLAADPDRLAALNDLAVAYYLDGRFDAARQLLDEVVARGSAREQQAALVNLGELYALEGHVSAAQAHFTSAREVDPTRPDPLYALALLTDLRGDTPGALAQLREAQRYDDGGSGRRSLAFAYSEERLHLEALSAEAAGERELAAARWRDLKSGRFPILAATAQRHLEEP